MRRFVRVLKPSPSADIVDEDGFVRCGSGDDIDHHRLKSSIAIAQKDALQIGVDTEIPYYDLRLWMSDIAVTAFTVPP